MRPFCPDPEKATISQNHKAQMSLLQGRCPDGTPGADEPVPHNYIYYAPTQKYYRPGFDEKNWEEAMTQCNSEGGTLVELRTNEGQGAIKMMNSKLHFSNTFTFHFVFSY